MKSFYIKLMTLNFVFSTILFSTFVSADGVYKWVDAQGKTQYGDSPPSNNKANKLKMPDIMIIENYADQWKPTQDPTENNTPTRRPAQQSRKDIPSLYTSITFLAPKSGQIIRANNGDVSAMLSIKPKLKKGHQIMFLLDGKEISKSRSRTSNFANLPRGPHSATVNIIDQSGKILGNSSVSFSVLRHSALFKKKAPEKEAASN